ncbi:hypothetical protein [Mesobacillus thioparans]|uniref:hypothetical protein n=1 Tax=Mesobacillus thioparans TaxID=370439 RepID=UPI0039F11215
MKGQTSNQKEKLTAMIVELAERKNIELDQFINNNGLDIKLLLESMVAAGQVSEQLLLEINANMN